MSSTEYRVNTRDMKFILNEMLNIGDTILKLEKYKDYGVDDVNMIIDEAAKFAETAIAPVNKEGDREGCRLEGDKVFIPEAYKKAYKQLCENGWNAIAAPLEYGGQGLPEVIDIAVAEMVEAACCSLAVYSGLTQGAARLIESFGTDDLKEKFMSRMYPGEWTGTMMLTEPNAGSAVGDTKSIAKKAGDHYLISGTKIFISGGDQDLTDNIIHAVLARVEGAPPGTKGLSLFVVPKYRVNDDGSLGEFNDVTCGGVEDKIGLHGKSTCLMNLGENGDCHGYILGEENQGMKLMFQMMNGARIGTGMQGVALAAGAYENCLSYAKERIQGVALENMRDPSAPRVEIIKHPDVRRMLMTQKAYIEGMRAMLFYCAYKIDLAENAATPEEHDQHMQVVELLTPICKAYCTDNGFRCCEHAVHTMGGYGCTKDYPVEQYLRDVKIAAVYEGTNGIQALDLLGRKMSMKGGALFMNFLGIVNEFLEKNKDNEDLKEIVEKVNAAKDDLANVAMHLAGLNMSGDILFPVLSATPFLYIFGDVLTAYLLLWQAVIAQEKLNALGKKPEEDPDAAFYAGKILTARFFINNILPEIKGRIEGIMSGDRSVVEIAEISF